MILSKEWMKGSTLMLVLDLLRREDMYGYQMTKTLEALSDNRFTLKEGTLYPLLHEMENRRMVESYYEATDSPRKRKYYRITSEGRKLLDEKKREWQSFSSTVNKVMEGSEDGQYAY